MKTRYYYGDNEHQFADLRMPRGKGPFPVAIVIHGGFWRSGFSLDLMDPISEDLTNHGIATWNIEYRRVGHEGGGWPGTFLDVAKATDHLANVAKDNPIDLNNVVTIGHSAGGHLAFWIAGRHHLKETQLLFSRYPLSIKGAISLAGVNDLEKMEEVHHIPEVLYQASNNPVCDLMGGRPKEVPQRYHEASPSHLLPIGVPLVLIHGALDVNVPIGMSYLFRDQAQKAGDNVTMIELSHAEHFKLIDPASEEWPDIISQLQKILK